MELFFSTYTLLHISLKRSTRLIRYTLSDLIVRTTNCSTKVTLTTLEFPLLKKFPKRYEIFWAHGLQKIKRNFKRSNENVKKAKLRITLLRRLQILFLYTYRQRDLIPSSDQSHLYFQSSMQDNVKY